VSGDAWPARVRDRRRSVTIGIQSTRIRFVSSPLTQASVEDALSLLAAVGAAWRPLPQSLPLAEAAGRVLADDVVAPIDLPPFDNAAMDGYALRHAEAGAPLALQGVSLAGKPGPAALAAGACVRITTGAPLPAGADTVVIKEDCVESAGRVAVRTLPAPGANIRRAGEDYARGQTALAAGLRLTPPRLGLLASLGMAAVPVRARPRLRLLATGDELVPPGQSLAPGQIHDSNSLALVACLRSLGVAPAGIGHLADDRAAVRAALAACDDVDLVLTCGGVSAGEADHLPGVLAELGEVLLWKVRIKPGMPFLLGRIGRTLVCGLPGNPVSAMVTCLVLVRPLLLALEGASERPPVLCARLAAPIVKGHRRCEYRRGLLAGDEAGVLWAREAGAQGSAMQHGLVAANVLIELPEEARTFAAGAIVRVHPLPWA
jgi:molybdopterin molybdotransferase